MDATKEPSEKQDGLPAPSFDSAELARLLWSEITENGLYGRSKNDFYDYVLYLLDKCDPGHFLYANDNADNERLLKVSATRIKAAKKSISVKFMNDKEYEGIFTNFIKRIMEGKVKVLLAEDDKYVMLVEDVATRSALETRLKRHAGTTLDYRLNTELVTVGRTAFISMLSKEASKNKELVETVKAFEREKKRQNVKESLEKAADAGSLAGAALSLAKDCLKAVVGNIEESRVTGKGKGKKEQEHGN